MLKQTTTERFQGTTPLSSPVVASAYPAARLHETKRESGIPANRPDTQQCLTW